MKPLAAFDCAARREIRGVFLDIDDTLTSEGRLTAVAYLALERLAAAGIAAVPITGRPAGWCDHIARMWPVEGVVGENGAFYFRYERRERRMRKRFLAGEGERNVARTRLARLERVILREVPGSAVASDQQYRESDLAIDYCEDVERLSPSDVARIVALFEQAGATAKVSSVHVNGWFGTYDKLGMTKVLMRECFAIDLDAERAHYVFIGDSPNDAPMFAYFPHSVGVANIRDFAGSVDPEPAYVCAARCGEGFAELVDALLGAANPA
jgi:HAD superfamily hydrolase (TIGR01484 family)